MSTDSNDARLQRVALGFVWGLIALVVATVTGIVIYQRVPRAPAPASVTPVSSMADNPQVRVVDGAVKFYFATGKADIAIGGNAALVDVVRGVTHGQRARISGFHDATGDAAANAALAKQRALAVHGTLLSLGVEPEMIELQKPAQTQASGSHAEARRVEVVLID